MIYQYFAERGGWRFVVLFHTGRKWLKALDTATLEVYRLPVRQQAQLIPYEMNRRTLASRLRVRRDRMRNCHHRFSDNAVKAAIRALRAKQ